MINLSISLDHIKILDPIFLIVNLKLKTLNVNIIGGSIIVKIVVEKVFVNMIKLNDDVTIPSKRIKKSII